MRKADDEPQQISGSTNDCCAGSEITRSECLKLAASGNPIPIHLVPVTATLRGHSSGSVGVDTFRGADTFVRLSVADDLTSFRTTKRT